MADGVRLPRPEWASEVLQRLDALPTVMRQQETIGRLMTVTRALTDERDALNKALETSRAELHAARHEIHDLQQVIIQKLK
jgi:hypothetical protein